MKRLMIISVSAGAGAVLMAAMILGGVLWFESRPARPKPWDSRTITATFDRVDTETVENRTWRSIVVVYTLQNSSDYDYRIPENKALELAGRLEQEKSLIRGTELSIDENVFVPAHDRARFPIHMNYPYDASEEPTVDDVESRKRYRGEIMEYIASKLSNLDGFVIYDTANRYKIEFHAGWKKKKPQTK